jgi:hypothetical protein
MTTPTNSDKAWSNKGMTSKQLPITLAHLDGLDGVISSGFLDGDAATDRLN